MEMGLAKGRAWKNHTRIIPYAFFRKSCKKRDGLEFISAETFFGATKMGALFRHLENMLGTKESGHNRQHTTLLES